MVGFIITGTQRLVGSPLSVPSKAGSATPTTVKGDPFRRIVLPTMALSPAKRVRQKPCCSTATGWPLRVRSSSGCSSRPR